MEVHKRRHSDRWVSEVGEETVPLSCRTEMFEFNGVAESVGRREKIVFFIAVHSHLFVYLIIFPSRNEQEISWYSIAFVRLSSFSRI